MKAITVKHLPPTDTKPRRLKVRAEGVPHLVFDANSTTPRRAAERLCVKFGWGTDLIEGTLPSGDLVFVFNPHGPLIRIGDGLANSAHNLCQQAGQVLSQRSADSLKDQYQKWDACK
jgi:hypothetical protein